MVVLETRIVMEFGVVIPIPKCEANPKFNVAFVVMHLEEKIWIGAFSVN